MEASLERIEVWWSDDISDLQEIINKFIKNHVSKVVDLRINTTDSSESVNTIHYAYLRYIPQ